MEIGELVDCVYAFAGTSSLIAAGCDEGNLFVYDAEKESKLYQSSKEEPVIVIRGNEENSSLIYAATETEIYLHDIRDPKQIKLLYKSPSEISDFAVKDNTIAVATMENDIQLVDKRFILRKPKFSPILPPVCNSLCFKNRDKIIAGYIDTSVGEWTISSKKFSAYQQQQNTQQMNPGVVHCVAYYNDIVACATQQNLAFYRNNKLAISGSFDHDGAVQFVTFAQCFPGNVTISSGSDGSLMVYDFDNNKVIDCIENEEEKVQYISSNKKFIAVADTSDNGSIGLFTPEDFLDHDENEDKAEE